MVKRGQVWWVELPEPTASEPGYKRPVLVVQSDEFNNSRINTVVVLAITSNLRLADAPGNLTLPMAKTGLDRDSVANVSQIITIDKSFLCEKIGQLDSRAMSQVGKGMRLVLGFS